MNATQFREQAISKLVEMGFQRRFAETALERTGYNTPMAIELLLTNIIPDQYPRGPPSPVSMQSHQNRINETKPLYLQKSSTTVSDCPKRKSAIGISPEMIRNMPNPNAPARNQDPFTIRKQIQLSIFGKIIESNYRPEIPKEPSIRPAGIPYIHQQIIQNPPRIMLPHPHPSPTNQRVPKEFSFSDSSPADSSEDTSSQSQYAVVRNRRMEEPRYSDIPSSESRVDSSEEVSSQDVHDLLMRRVINGAPSTDLSSAEPNSDSSQDLSSQTQFNIIMRRVLDKMPSDLSDMDRNLDSSEESSSQAQHLIVMRMWRGGVPPSESLSVLDSSDNSSND